MIQEPRMNSNTNGNGRIVIGASRREFMALGLAAGAALALGGASTALGRRSDAPAGKSLRILILGGSGFLGPAVIDAALARGHKITVFNRGLTEKKKEELYGEHLPDGVVRLVGNRDPEKNADEKDPASPKGLSQLEGDTTWDAVVDNSGYVPRIVKASAELLRDRVKHYTFISSVSVYAAMSEPGGDETRPLATIADPKDEDFRHPEKYGALKALSEQAAEAAMPGRVNNIRPGFIVGPWDPTDRFTYWPQRVAKGGEMLAPGSREDQIQLIDVRDLGEFIIRGIERNTTGVYNALGPNVGPNQALTMGALLDACKKVSGSDASFTWVPTDFLLDGHVQAGELPIWLPTMGETAGFHAWNVGKSVAAGLTFRPIEETVRATMEWWKKLPETRRNEVRAGIKADREAAILKAWHEKKG
jgi:2'-hydroxyisoflavone reductase